MWRALRKKSVRAYRHAEAVARCGRVNSVTQNVLQIGGHAARPMALSDYEVCAYAAMPA
jgi:hypothetical protein